jgi:sugar/nucleoside kinase (ribokinase family)
VAVLGDLMVDVVVRPERAVEPGTDVPGRVTLRAGGSAANTARWLGRLGAAVSLISAVGRDPAGRALAEAVRADGVMLRLVRVAGLRTGRIGVVVAPGGERSFVADRGAADALRPDDVRPAWLARTELLHLPVYSLLGRPLGLAGRRAIELARVTDARVSLDLASVGPLLAGGRAATLALVREAAPDLLFATAGEAAALLGHEEAVELEREGRVGAGSAAAIDALLGLAAVVVIKRGPRGAMVLARSPSGPLRVDVPADRVAASDTTGAGDAFDAGFILAWLTGGPGTGATRNPSPARLRQAALAGHRAARRLLTARRPELRLL